MQSRHSLWTRYLFPVGLLKAPVGDMYLQRSMLLSNLEALRRWMPHYVKVHASLALLCSLLLVLSVHLDMPWWLAGLSALLNGAEILLFVTFSGLALAARLPQPPGPIR
jgi:hypothetical protein